MVHFLDGEGPISFWGYKEQKSKLILPESDNDDDDDDGDDDDDFLDGYKSLFTCLLLTSVHFCASV